MSTIDAAIAAQRAALIARDRRTAARIARAHLLAKRQLVGRISAVTARIDRATRVGDIINPDWLRQLDEMRSLEKQLGVSYRGYTAAVFRDVEADRAWAARFGVSSAEDLISAQDASAFRRLNRRAVENIVAATTGDGSPLVAVLDRVAGAAAQDLVDILTTGVALGQSPNKLAALASRRLDVDLSRARLIARTETLRAYRTASLSTYQEHGDVVQEWVWHASLDERSCGACWALHGRRFPTSEPMGTHPNCRCAMVPVVRYGPDIESGVDAFERLDADAKRRVLGPSAYRAYDAGAIRLDDMVAERVTGDWGTTRGTKSLRQAIGPDGARRYYRRGG
jgi:SPP1 gp7 family putative phage head morphogenesis protein